MAGRKQGPGLPFTPWDQIKIGLDPSSKLPENFQKSVASIFGAASKKRDALDDEHGSRLGKTKKGKVCPPDAKKETKKETQASSFFADCPLCFKSFHPSLIVSHVDTCLGAAEETAAREKAAEARAEERRAQRAKALARDDVGEKEDGFEDLLDSHRASSSSSSSDDDDDFNIEGVNDDDDENDLSVDEEDVQQATQLPNTEERPRTSVDAKPGNNAFATLMTAQRESTCRKCWSAWIDTETKTWRWCVEDGSKPGKLAAAGGMGPVVWTAVQRLFEKTAGGEKCETLLTLATDVREVEWRDIRAECAKAKGWVNGGDDDERNSRSAEPGKERPHMPPGVTKSAIQKSVRRGKVMNAVKATSYFMGALPEDGLRRLPIVCIEDAVLHPSLPLIVWFMAAHSKGWFIPPEARGAAVRFIAEVAACPYKDRDLVAAIEADEEDLARRDTASGAADPLCNLAVATRDLSNESACHVLALLVRAKFGGLRGDVGMLRGAAKAWRRRFLDAEAVGDAGVDWHARLREVYTAAAAKAAEATGGVTGLPDKSPGQTWTAPPLAAAAPVDVDVIAERDVPTSAIDFHVSNIVEELMQQDKVRAALLRAVERAPTLGDDLGETLRSCIWTHCSSVTDKRTFAPGKETDVVPETQTQGACESALRDLWEEIEGPAESFQRRRIKRLFF